MHTVEFTAEGFGKLLELAIKNRGQDYANNLLVETVVKNKEAFVQFFIDHSKTANK